MDGVLLDSEEYICRAGILMFREKGLEATPEDFLEFTGMGEDRYLGGVAEKHNFPFDLAVDKARCYEIYGEIVKGRLEPLNGVVDFIDRCREAGLKLAVATSADEVKMKINPMLLLLVTVMRFITLSQQSLGLKNRVTMYYT